MIKFGTSGWRGIIARDFTFDNVRLATQGIADYLPKVQNPKSKVVILGHDTRFLGREFSLAAAEVLARNGLTPLLCQRDAPTPVIARTIRARKALGGINMTASHNPAEYQGLKFSTSNGTPVKSCNTMRATMNGISSVRVAVGCHWASSRTFFSETFLPSQLRSTASSTNRMDTGSLETLPTPAFSSAGSE